MNRVVAQLEKAGAIVTREIGSDGRQAVFRVVDVTGPKAARPYLHLGDQVRVVAARLQATTCSSTWQSISTPTAG